MPTLIVLRHAKAEAGLGIPDIDRKLTDRGRRDANAAGDWLRANGLVPERVLCSPAARTRETLARLALDAETAFEPGIYDNDPDGLLTLVSETPGAGTLLLVGHNPSVHHLVHDLTGQAPDAFPTCALAVIDFPSGEWADVRAGLGTLRTVHTPKD
ncbi:SixA phosphatase family protein [Actinomadura luteofluorescens]|uniref:SixA phosphatase family protein n=1 Tax=Actinomadura luteofluorescens TaxID=46163 RepID=UPI0034983726